MKQIKIRNKNAILELLKDDVKFDRISIIKGLDKDKLTEEIVEEAEKRGISIHELSRSRMDKRRSGESYEAILGFLNPIQTWSFDKLLDHIYQKNEEPFFLLINRVNFESNIGVIARTAYAAGVNGLFFQGDEDDFFNEDTIHYSVGALARLPIVKMNIFDAIHEFHKNQIKTFALDMEGKTYFKEDLTGPVAFVMGAEREGTSDNINSKCDTVLSIPMKEGLDSMNVSSSASIILYEKVRQNSIK